MRRLAVLTAYTITFWGGLPWALWAGAQPLDRWLGRWSSCALGAVPAVLGAWLVVAAIVELRTRGQGWPVSALPPPRFVQSGPYALLRHPIYLGFQLLVVGVSLLVGSPGLLILAVVALGPGWLVYALVEERGLARRFGAAFGRYRRRVGLLPRFSLVPVARLARCVGLIRLRVVSGREHLPARGPAILVANHACYTDPVFLQLVTRRRVWFPTTSEAFRPRGIMGWAARHWPTFVVRRYRVDPAAGRVMLDLLDAGEVIGIFPERERSVLGRWLGADRALAGQLRRLGMPVIPVGFDGNYDCGPRWAGKLALHPSLRVRIGPPISWSGDDPVRTLDAALRGVLGEDPQRVRLERWDLGRLATVVWRCPRCADLARWRPAALSCGACGARWSASGDGRVVDEEGRSEAFADWAASAWTPEHEPIVVRGRLFAEPSVWGPLRPLQPVADGEMVVGPDGLRWPEGSVALSALRSVTTERADTLQLATAEGMWQLATADQSAFRLQHALTGWLEQSRRGAPSTVDRDRASPDG